MPTHRGPITSHHEPAEPSPVVRKAQELRRGKRNATPRDPNDPLKGMARFKTLRGYRNLAIKLAFLPPDEDERDDELTRAALEWLNTDKIRFHDGALATREKPLIDWLRYRIHEGRLPDVEEDLSMLDIACPQCGKTFKNSKSGHKALAQHIYDEHQDEAT